MNLQILSKIACFSNKATFARSLLLFLILTTHLSAQMKVLSFSGSTRGGSFNKKLVQEASCMAKNSEAVVKQIDLKNFPMPFYDGDLESTQGMPYYAKEFKRLMVESDVIIIASPDYNGSLSAVLKNALDWASRSEDGKSSRDAFKGKKFVLMSTSPGKSGGIKGLLHLRSIIENIGGSIVLEPLAIGQSHNVFDVNGHVKDEAIKLRVQQLVKAGLKK